MHHGHEENPAHGEEGHVHVEGEHEYEHEEADLTLDEPNMEITAVLLKIRNQMAKCNMATSDSTKHKNASCFSCF